MNMDRFIVFKGQLTISTGPFSIAMLNYQRVYLRVNSSWSFWWLWVTLGIGHDMSQPMLGTYFGVMNIQKLWCIIDPITMGVLGCCQVWHWSSFSFCWSFRLQSFSHPSKPWGTLVRSSSPEYHHHHPRRHMTPKWIDRGYVMIYLSHLIYHIDNHGSV